MGGTTAQLNGGSLEWISASGLSDPISSGSEPEGIAIETPNGVVDASDFYVHVDNTPAEGKSWTFTLNDNGSDTSLSCTIDAGDSTCYTTAATVVTLTGGALAIDVLGTSGIAAAYAEFGWRATEN